MKYIEHWFKPIMPINEDTVYCQCLSADFLVHPGLLVDRIEWLDKENPDYILDWAQMENKGDCIYDTFNGVANLIVKSFIYEYCKEEMVYEALKVLRGLLEWNDWSALYFGNVKENFLGLKWSKVRKMIKEIFADTDIEIYVRRCVGIKGKFEILQHIAERTRCL